MWKEDLLVQLLERISALECPSLQKASDGISLSE
jgi:hypothetical protein